MFLGRVTGWVLIGLAVIMASADVVLALGPAEYAGIVTADVVALLAGHAPDTTLAGRSWWSAMGAAFLDLPAWTAVGLAGLVLVVGCRRRPRRLSFRR